jgi:O-6-methylguanine DNA methyltransferase
MWSGAYGLTGFEDERATQREPWGSALGTTGIVLLLPLLTPSIGFAQTDHAPEAGATNRVGEEVAEDAGLLRDLRRHREWLERQGLELDFMYIGAYLVNTPGGIDQDDAFLGNLDMTLTWHTEPILGRDLGTFFFYGLYDHGDRPSDDVGDLFRGRTRQFDLRLAPSDTAFQQRVWRALAEIPYGETLSYGALAARIGRPTAARPVGAANGRNPIGIIIPCHRVIGASGALTGYGGGLDAKRWLLDLERGQPSLH